MSFVVTERDGTITVTSGVLDRIAAQAAELTVQYGRVLPDTALAVQSAVAGAFETMCGLGAVVDVHLEELQ